MMYDRLQSASSSQNTEHTEVEALGPILHRWLVRQGIEDDSQEGTQYGTMDLRQRERAAVA
jgi:hypothetical protein